MIRLAAALAAAIGVASATATATATATDSDSPSVATPTPAATPAAAAPATPPSRWSFSLSEEGVLRSWQDDPSTRDNEQFLDGMNRLYLLGTRPHLELGLQGDVAVATPNDRAGLTGDRDPPLGWTSSAWIPSDVSVLVLEKKFARARFDAVSVEVGDAYRALGRGLALSLVKNTELDIDTSIEGLSADVTAGPFSIAAWAGYSNPQTITTGFRNRIRRDPRDLLGGARVAATAGPVELAAHASLLRIDPLAPGRTLVRGELLDLERADVVGGSISAPDLAGKADLYLEGNAALYSGQVEEAAADRSGHGFYGALTGYLGGLTLQLEGKRYSNLEVLNVRQSETAVSPYDYSTPPTLEKENVVTRNVSEAVNSNDVTGGRLAASMAVGGGIARLTYARFDDLGHRHELGPGSIRNGNERIDHLYGGFERRGAAAGGEGRFYQVTAGVRFEKRMADPRGEHTALDRLLPWRGDDDAIAHADVDVLFPWRGLDVEVKYLVYRQYETSVFSGDESRFDVHQLVASLRPWRRLALSALVDTTTDLRVLEGIGGREGNLSRYTFGALEVAVDPTDRSTIRAFAGATQGGLKCSGGTCRVIPAFEGARLEWLARF